MCEISTAVVTHLDEVNEAMEDEGEIACGGFFNSIYKVSYHNYKESI